MSLVATPGAANANSYETLDEFNDYLDTRLHVPATVVSATDDDKEKALIMGTRALDQILSRFRRLEILTASGRMTKFYVTRPYWTGTPTTATQGLPWPRIGMFDRNGNAIDTATIPQDLKDAESEMAILAITTDILADNAVVVQGITSLKAGPVELQFKDYIQKRLLPDAVLLALVPSWITDELVEQIPQAQFRTIGNRSC
jgi:hypothetical protein